MPKFSKLSAAIERFRITNGRNADSMIRAQRTGNPDIDDASSEMLEQALGATNTKPRPKNIHELDTKAIWDRYNSAGKNKSGG